MVSIHHRWRHSSNNKSATFWARSISFWLESHYTNSESSSLFIESSREIKAFSGYRIVDCIWIDPIESISAHLRVKPLIADRLVIDKLHLEPLVALGFYFSSYLHRLRQQADWFHSIYFNGRENSIAGYRWSVWVSVWEITSWSSWLRKKLPVDL